MGMKSTDVVDALVRIAAKITSEKDYITELDAVLGDGDHWVNMNKGYQAILAREDELRTMGLAELFKTVGMILMSSIGGSSGVLYGSAFLQSSKALADVDEIQLAEGLLVMEAALEAIMTRGKAKPGDKTMIDPLSEAVIAYRDCLKDKADTATCLQSVTEAAERGMKATKDMVAMKGRGTYQIDKGVGHIDAGAVTMLYTIEGFASSV